MPQSNQQGANLGSAIGNLAQGIVDNALSATQRAVSGELAKRQAQRAELELALRSTNSRPARLELQRQIDQLDREILELEKVVQRVEQKVIVNDPPPAQSFSGTAPPFRGDDFNPAPMVIGVVGILFVAFPLTLAIVRFLWKRASNAPAPAISAEQQRRFDRLEQSVDAIAIEIERISENQRYLTKMLAEPKKDGLGAGR
jgi:hypothetical protein